MMKIKMIKKFTGVKFTPQEFRLLVQCLRCGKASNMIGDVCDNCLALALPECSMCEILLRNGTHKFYTYDIKEDHRSGEEGFKASKEFVREFEYIVDYNNPLNTEMLCGDCLGWQGRMKNRCKGCERCFINTRENYKANGNYCEKCATGYQITQPDDNKDADDRLEGQSIRPSLDSNQGVQADLS